MNSDNDQDKHGSEGFISRWARRKQAVKQVQQPDPEEAPQSAQPTTPADSIDSVDPIDPINSSGPQATRPAITAEQAPETEPVEPTESIVLTDADMPDIDTLDEHSDYTGFMSPGVSEALRKLALRKMFKGTTFHQRDGLDDYDDDYTQFARLGSIVTADMKHMAGVETRRQLEAATKQNQTHSAQEDIMPTPREAALATLQQHSAEPTGRVEYHSGGKVLVIGGENALLAATQMQAPLQAQVLLTEDSALANGRSFITLQGERSISLNGWLGHFELTLSDNMGNTETLNSDLVLDMSTDALMTPQIKAPGYFHTDADGLEAVLAGLSESVGTFAKPRYFDYNPDICAHASSGLSGCRNCIEACPTEAIISIGEKIRVEPNLCQGGGTCATVCPTGAIRYNYPAPGHHVDQLRRMLKSWQDADGGDVTVLLHSGENTPDTASLPEHILPFALEELASAGAEIWAAALSFGAKQILLLDADDTPPVSRQHLRHQLSILSTQLAGLGYPDNVVRLIPALPEATGERGEILAAPEPSLQMPYFPPATQSGMNDKRQQWLFALDHLYKYAVQPEEQIPLPAGAPFGRIKVDKQACTLCMACTTICPASALSGGTDSPQLRLFTANCVQCGLCETGCPEKAITLEPVFMANRETRNRTQLLHEEAAFHCVSCGKPFASQSTITTILGRLQGHKMFQSERAKQRLKMCEDCRVVDVVQDEEAMGQPAQGTDITGQI